MGYRLYSGFEAEFIVVDSTSMKPVFEGVDLLTDLVLSRNSNWLFELERSLQISGVDVQAFHAEHLPGQFECCMQPKYGIDTFDNMILFKQACKEILPRHGYTPTFMTRPFLECDGSSGFHFNHSLWDNSGQSMFYDASKPDKMTDVMRYWIGGIMKHIKALLVLCSPTPNCFRRLHEFHTPDREDWDINNRRASIRVRNNSERCCLVESRLPSAACNPYLVAASTIAAGIDGIENKIEPPARGISDENLKLPSFEEALTALENDTQLVERLGGEFVKWWLTVKRDNEQHLLAENTQHDFEIERNQYFEFL